MVLRPFSIGPVQIAPNLILSPMSGVTNSAFRQMVKKASAGKVGLLVSEFISVEGLTRSSLRSHQMLQFKPEERPISIQIFGTDIDRIVMAAEIVEESGADLFDINCGCPVPKVVKRGGGAELMRNLSHLKKILEAVRSVLSIPFTVKIRTGWDSSSINAVEAARLIEDCGGAMIAIHGRTRAQGYSGEADWETIARVKATVKIPVVGSGDIKSPEDVKKRLFQSGVDGVMIGRAAIQNPWIFRQINDFFNSMPPYQPDFAAIHAMLLDYANILSEIFPDRALVGKMKQIIAQITKGIHGGARLRERVMAARFFEEIFQEINTFFASDKKNKKFAWENWAMEQIQR